MRRGSLRIYLGAAPGVGKTFAMLGEGNRRADRGTDVVVGVVETHGRAQTAAEIGDLEVVPRRAVEHRGTTLSELDVDGVVGRRPELVLVDELAHTNAPGSRNEKRWQDVEELLDAGIDVISTLNVQHLESLNDVIQRITGTTQRETVPDAVVRRADQIELVDMTPEALRRRMAHGNIYPAERIDAALANYFRPGNLGALRELALLWVADRVEESLQSYLADHGITDTWETRERVVVAMTGATTGDAVVRRAARMAGRVRGELVGVHVTDEDGRVRPADGGLDRQRRLLTELGGTYFEVVGRDPARALADFARAEQATQLVIGSSGRSRRQELVQGSMVARLARLTGPIDLHVIATDAGGQVRIRRPSAHRSAVPRERQAAAWVVAVVGLPAVTVALTGLRDHLGLSTQLLVFLSLVLAVAAIGGRLVSVVAAVAASGLANFFFVPPHHTFTIDGREDAIALAVFLAVAVTVGTLVDRAAQRAGEAIRARAEAEALARAAASLAADPDPLPALVEQIRTTFSLDAARITHRADGERILVAAYGDPAVDTEPVVMSIGPGPGGGTYELELFGRQMGAADIAVLRALSNQLAVALEAQRLQAGAAEADALAEADAVRTALLRAVSHDLRSPLSTIKAMVTGLRDRSVRWSDEQVGEALEAIDDETDRLNALVGNLLDASRLQTGALAVSARPLAIDEPVESALRSLGPQAGAVGLDLARDLPVVLADPALLERALANVLANALRHSPAPGSVTLSTGAVGREVHVRIVDRGPGIAARDRARVVAPFQRLGDQRTDDGVGLGLAIAVGFMESMRGSLSLDDTPGGGLTITLAVPQVEPSEATTPPVTDHEVVP